ncbi:MAG TPA: BON domain-containing protein [Thermoanaerobaculia bacterium]
MAQKQTIKSSPDRKLATRVRALIAKQVSHPGAIAVYVEQGTVTLGGPILASELAELRDAVTNLDGVHAVLDHLEAHETAEGVPELQNGRSTPKPKRSGRGRLVAGAVLGGLGLGLLATSGLAGRKRKKKIDAERDAEEVPVQGTEEGTFEPVTV